MAATSLEQVWRFHREGDLNSARDACRALLAEDPRDCDALHLLGVIELQSGRAQLALRHLQQTASIDPTRSDAWNHLGIVHAKLANAGEAVEAFERAVQLNGTSAQVHFNLAIAYLRLDRTDDAISSLRRATAADAEFADAHAKLGMLLRRQGELAEAMASLRTATTLNPNDEAAQKALAKCQEQLEQQNDPSPKERLIQSFAKLSDMAAVARPTSPPGDENLFFVFGMPKSGTTWLQLLIDSHPQLACRPEDQFVPLFEALGRVTAGYNRLLAEVDRRTAQQGAEELDDTDAAYLCAAAIRRLLGKRFAEPGVLRSGAKDNAIIETFEGFARQFAAARFVYVLRDPRDVAVSSWFHNHRVEADFGQRAGTFESWAIVTAHAWNRDVQRVLTMSRPLGERFHVVRYEDLQDQAEPTLKRLLAFLGVDCDAPTVRRCHDACSFGALTGGRRQGEENRDSFFRRGVAGDWKNHLGDQAAREVLLLAGDMMSRFGYC